MESAGLHVMLCTAPSTFQYEHAAFAKYCWVRTHLGEKWLSRLVLTRDKSVIKGRVLIDDKPAIKGACGNPDWTHIVFEQSYNLHVQDRPRLREWSSWREVISPFFPKLELSDGE